jgi:hypothetical protein
MNDKNHPRNIIICVPVFNDWTTALELIRNIQLTFSTNSKVQIILIDDGSTEQPDLKAFKSLTNAKFSVEIIKLVTNIGHQRAIAIGLSAIETECRGDAIIVMDGDGEDNPAHISSLLNEINETAIPSIVLARRNRRSEGIFFKLGYKCFKILHRGLTGTSCDVGNFSAIPSKWLKQLTHMPELWNHYAATVISSKIPVRKVNCPRSHRYSGQSKMNLTSLVTHGLRAISVFGETVGVRVSMALGAIGLVSFAGLVSVILIRLFTDLAIPGWATNATGLLLILCVNFLMLTAMSLLFILGARSTTEFIPTRDWAIFVAEWEKLDE